MTIALDILGLWSPAATLPPPDVGHRGLLPVAGSDLYSRCAYLRAQRHRPATVDVESRGVDCSRIRRPTDRKEDAIDEDVTHGRRRTVDAVCWPATRRCGQRP